MASWLLCAHRPVGLRHGGLAAREHLLDPGDDQAIAGSEPVGDHALAIDDAAELDVAALDGVPRAEHVDEPAVLICEDRLVARARSVGEIRAGPPVDRSCIRERLCARPCSLQTPPSDPRRCIRRASVPPPGSLQRFSTVPPTSERAAASAPRCVITSRIAAPEAASNERTSLGTETVSKIAEISSAHGFLRSWCESNDWL
jgi:hypothetical protein